MIKSKLFLHSIIILSFLFSPLLQAKDIWILIHGTFAQTTKKISNKTAWWKPGHKFHEQLLKSTNNAVIYSFDWCGSNSHEKRIEAGKKLAQFITSIAHKNDTIHLVGHSHGANVGILGAQELFKQNSNLKISKLFALGAPISHAYYPQESSITKVYNLFSYADFVQPVVGLFKRVFPEEDHIHNLQVKVAGICPNHYGIHDPIIACYLPKLDTLLPNSKPHAIHFFYDKHPAIEYDSTREQDLEIDKLFTNQLITCFAESKKHGHQTVAAISKDTKNRLLRLWNRGAFNPQSVSEPKS